MPTPPVDFPIFGGANHDPERWERADSFDIHRPRKAHLSFAQGLHTCLGMHPALMELEVALGAVLDLPGPCLAGDAEIRGGSFRSAPSLPVAFEATS